MRACQFLIIGGGPAADAAVRCIRKPAGAGPIVVVPMRTTPL
jgi:hypothetical protein